MISQPEQGSCELYSHDRGTILGKERLRPGQTPIPSAYLCESDSRTGLTKKKVSSSREMGCPLQKDEGHFRGEPKLVQWE